MTLSEIRRRIDALKRRFARELAIIKLRRIAEAVADDWTPDDPPKPSAVIQRIVRAGFRLTSFARLRRCLDDARRQGEVPDPESIVLSLLPWGRELPLPRTPSLGTPGSCPVTMTISQIGYA